MRIAFVVLLVVTTPLFGQSVEERLTRLEQEMRELRAENVALRRQLEPPPAPQPAPVPATAAAEAVVRPAGKEPRLSIGGYIQAQGEAGDRVDARFDENDRMFVRRARIAAQGGFTENIDFKAEVELSGTLGSTASMRAQGTDMFVHWKRYPAAQIRFGQFKTPYSFEQLQSDTVLATPERGLGVDRISVGRQLGVQLSGDLAGKRVAYAVGAFNGNGVNVSANDDDDLLLAARLGATLHERGKLKWSGAVNGYRSDDHSAAAPPEAGLANHVLSGIRHAWGADTQLLTGRGELLAEYLRATYEPDAGAGRDLSALSVIGGWRFTPKWQGVLRYETYDAVTTDTDVWTAGVNHFIKGHDLKLQLHLMHSEAGDRVVARVQTIF